jgi:hypothetical protein
MRFRYHRKALDVVSELPLMEPKEYCRQWVQHIQPGERGYRAACIRALEKATFGVYKFDTIDRNWGKDFERRPEAALELLRVANMLNEIDIGLDGLNASIVEVLAKVRQVAPYKQEDK